jgi:hypothetical protein
MASKLTAWVAVPPPGLPELPASANRSLLLAPSIWMLL